LLAFASRKHPLNVFIAQLTQDEQYFFHDDCSAANGRAARCTPKRAAVQSAGFKTCHKLANKG
jgi:hypothetical protein